MRSSSSTPTLMRPVEESGRRASGAPFWGVGAVPRHFSPENPSLLSRLRLLHRDYLPAAGLLQAQSASSPETCNPPVPHCHFLQPRSAARESHPPWLTTR